MSEESRQGRRPSDRLRWLGQEDPTSAPEPSEPGYRAYVRARYFVPQYLGMMGFFVVLLLLARGYQWWRGTTTTTSSSTETKALTESARRARATVAEWRALSLQNPQGAIDAYSRAIALDPTVTLAWLNRGATRAQIGDTTGAWGDFMSARKHIATDSSAGALAALNMASIAMARRDGARASAFLDSAARVLSIDDGRVIEVRAHLLSDVRRDTAAAVNLLDSTLRAWGDTTGRVTRSPSRSTVAMRHQLAELLAESRSASQRRRADTLLARIVRDSSGFDAAALRRVPILQSLGERQRAFTVASALCDDRAARRQVQMLSCRFAGLLVSELRPGAKSEIGGWLSKAETLGDTKAGEIRWQLRAY